MTTYKIVRVFMNGRKRKLFGGLTLAEAKEYCGNPATSSRTCTHAAGKARTTRCGQWFDSFDQE